MLALVATGCGTTHPATQMHIAVVDEQRLARSYSLSCEPDSGTAPHPQAICTALKTNPNLLVGGPGLDHSCPAGARAFRVTGSFRGYPVDASFSACSWVPGQGDGLNGWSELMHDAVKGSSANPPVSTILTRVELVRRRALMTRALGLHRGEVLLARERRLAITTAARLLPWKKPDRLALAFLRDLALGVGLPDGPRPAEARIYSTTLFGAERVSGARDMTRPAQLAVYVLALRFGYKDYEGRQHLAGDELYAIVDACSLTDIGGGIAKSSSLAGLGPTTPLPL